MVAMVAIDGRTLIASSRRPSRGSGVVYRVAPHAMATVREEDPLDGWPVATMATMATP